MLERIMLRHSHRIERAQDSDYVPNRAILEITQLRNSEASSKRLVVTFPPRFNGSHAYDLFARRIAKDNAVLQLKFHDQILEPNAERVVESHEYIRDAVIDQITELVRTHGYTDVQLIGISLGNVPLAMVAEKFPNFSSATMVAGADELAHSMWDGIMTQDLMQAFSDQGLTVGNLSEAWKDLAPINHLDAFNGKKVNFIVSTKDHVIRTDYQRNMVKALRQNGSLVEPKYTKLDHYGAILKYFARGQVR